jgi:hypothetical protein
MRGLAMFEFVVGWVERSEGPTILLKKYRS